VAIFSSSSEAYYGRRVVILLSSWDYCGSNGIILRSTGDYFRNNLVIDWRNGNCLGNIVCSFFKRSITFTWAVLRMSH
jgi:hypothetical protein